jgi:hypothetical protein
MLTLSNIAVKISHLEGYYTFIVVLNLECKITEFIGNDASPYFASSCVFHERHTKYKALKKD